MRPAAPAISHSPVTITVVSGQGTASGTISTNPAGATMWSTPATR
jgi:hypothetical protein